MTKRARRLAFACWAAAAAVLSAQSTEIRVTPVFTDGQVHASFSMPGAFSDDAREVLKSGLLLTFRFTIALRRPNGLWWDQTLTETTAAASVKFDNLTRSYQVSKMIDEHVVWSNRTMDVSLVRTWMTTFDRVPLGERLELAANEEYYLQVRMWTSPRRTFSLWPWRGDDGTGRADFTNIR
jgi:hypothetical protein